MQKRNFAEQLRELVKDSGIRQNEIAGELGVSAAAISQFLHGQTLPSSDHLDRLLSLLHTSASTNRDLRELWMLCRAIPTAEGESELNHNFFLLRARNGFSLAQTAWGTGISEKRLTRIEKDPDARITSRERSAFRRFFGVSPDDDFTAFHENWTQRTQPQVAENGSCGVPQLSLAALKEFKPEYSLLEFAMAKREGFQLDPVTFCREPVLVVAKSEELLFPYRGTLRILLTRKRPAGFLPLDLCFYPGGFFRLRQGKGGKKTKFLPVSQTDEKEKTALPVWKIAVAEVTFQPVIME